MKIPRNQLRISITSGCNMKCVYCHNEGNIKTSILSLCDIEKIINGSLKFGLKEIRLTGGDPMTHPNVIKICKMIKDKYNLNISVNTNCVKYDDLLYLSKQGYINRIVVGLDYFDGTISKNSSIGISSKIIRNRIIELKKFVDNISVDIVYSNNKEDIFELIKWGILNKIRIKVIEIEENIIGNKPTEEYIDLMNEIIKTFHFDTKLDNNEEVNCFNNDFLIVSFFHSLCRLRRCDICKRIQLRINSNGTAKPCIFYNNQDIDLLKGDVSENIQKVLNRKVDYHFGEDYKLNETR